MKKLILFFSLLSPLFSISQYTVLDHTPTSPTSANWRVNSLGQSFTVPSSYGQCCMNQLKVHMLNINSLNAGPAQLRIYQGNGMSGPVIYGPENVMMTGGVNIFNLNTNLNITPGAQYTYELYYGGNATKYVINSAINTHTGGHSWQNRSSSTATSQPTYDDIFEIYYNVPLPITLTSFKANCKDGNTQLSWVTASEINNDYFTIERSTDALNFEAIATVNGNGNSSKTINYSWIDDNPINETTYYRLKQTDFDGRFEYHGVKAVNCSFSNDISIFPNPFENRFTIQLSENTTDPISVEIIDCLGRKIQKQIIENATTEIILDSKIPKGRYFVKVFNETTQIVEQIVKMK